MLDQANVIIGVTNRIGKIKVQAFQKYVKDAYVHWLYNFKKFVHIKSSLHWTLGHVAELIAKNGGYTLAGVSENSFENWIKAYRDLVSFHGGFCTYFQRILMKLHDFHFNLFIRILEYKKMKYSNLIKIQ